MRKKQQRIGKFSIFVEDRFRISKTQAKAQQICQAFVSTKNCKQITCKQRNDKQKQRNNNKNENHKSNYQF